MENNNEKAEKLEVKSLRLSPSVDAKIKELSGEYGNVNGFIEYLLTLNEKESNAIKYPDFKANIESFSVLLSKLDKAFMAIIETGANAAQFAKEEVSKELENNKDVIADLLATKKENLAVINKMTNLLAEETSLKEKYQRQCERLLDLNDKNSDIIASKKNEILTLSGELNKYKKYADENAVLISSISELEEKNKTLINAIAESDLKIKALNNESSLDKVKIEDLKIQMTELKTEIKINKDYAKEVENAYKAELKELSKSHKDEITEIAEKHEAKISSEVSKVKEAASLEIEAIRSELKVSIDTINALKDEIKVLESNHKAELERVNNVYEGKLDREIDRLTMAANKEIELVKKEAGVTEHKLLSDISILQEKYKEMSIVLDATSQELDRLKTKNNKEKSEAK